MIGIIVFEKKNEYFVIGGIVWKICVYVYLFFILGIFLFDDDEDDDEEEDFIEYFKECWCWKCCNFMIDIDYVCCCVYEVCIFVKLSSL